VSYRFVRKTDLEQARIIIVAGDRLLPFHYNDYATNTITDQTNSRMVLYGKLLAARRGFIQHDIPRADKNMNGSE